MAESRRLNASHQRWATGLTLVLAAAVGIPALPMPLVVASELRNSPVVRAVKEARASIVNIHGRKTVRGENPQTVADGVKQVNGMGTGVIIDSRGYILTNHHVVDGVSNIQVTLNDGRDVVARIVSHDPKTDLAVIKIDAKETLLPIRFGTSSDLMDGEPVVAVGNAYGYSHTVTEGIISALHRSVQVSDDQKYNDLIQTSASINPGNSGGPLLNIDGECIGINVAVRVGAQGIGFAIPIDEALEIGARLMSVERLEKNSHGITGSTSTTSDGRVFTVTSIRKESAAEKAGLQPGDVITGVDSHSINRALDVELALLGHKPGEEVTVEVNRGGSSVTTQLALVAANRGSSKPLLAERVWTTLGVKLAPMNDAEFKQLGSRYRGGLQVLDVRKNGAAWQQGIRSGDVLVGLHIWETISLENIAYILDREDLSVTEPVVFYIVRGTDTLYGQIRLAERTKP